MLTCLFWNLKSGRADQESLVAGMAVYHQVDILVLAESTVDSELLLKELKGLDTAYDRPEFQHHRFQTYTRFPGGQLSKFDDDDRVSIRRLNLPGKNEILFASIHFYDRRNYDRRAPHSKSISANQTIRQAEIKAGHARTIISGDFNMNPFDDGMIDTDVGFGAMMSRELALRHSDPEVTGAQRFYNPMWSRLGRQTPDPPGTHYWGNVSDPFNIFWQSIDQVLVRPPLFGSFPDEEFRVLTRIPLPGLDTAELIQNTGKHWKIQVSDHLPIIFKLDPPAEDSDG